MSIEAINAAWLADVRPAPKKLVLLCLANMHNGRTGQLNPSVSAVAKACGISHDQARRHLHALIADGLLSVIGNEGGGYHKEASRRYRLDLSMPTPCTDATPCADATPCTDAADHLHACSQPLASMQPTPCTDASQTRRNIEKNQKGTGSNARTRAASIECPTDVDQKVWADFMAVRKAKRAPMTSTALEGIKREATKAGLTLQEALTRCVEWTWQGFDAEWYAKRVGSTLNKQEALEQRNRSVADAWLVSQGHKPTRHSMPRPENFDNKVYYGGPL